jgi:hypothetical protein
LVAPGRKQFDLKSKIFSNRWNEINSCQIPMLQTICKWFKKSQKICCVN